MFLGGSYKYNCNLARIARKRGVGRSLAREEEEEDGKRNVQKKNRREIDRDRFSDERFEAPFRLSQSSTLGSIASLCRACARARAASRRKSRGKSYSVALKNGKETLRSERKILHLRSNITNMQRSRSAKCHRQLRLSHRY